MQRHDHDLLDLPVSLLVLLQLLNEHIDLRLLILMLLMKSLDDSIEVFEPSLHPQDVSLTILVRAATSTRSMLILSLRRHNPKTTRASARHYRIAGCQLVAPTNEVIPSTVVLGTARSSSCITLHLGLGVLIEDLWLHFIRRIRHQIDSTRRVIR